MSVFVILSLYLCNSLPCFYLVEEMEPRWDEVRQKKGERKRMREAGKGNVYVCVRAFSPIHTFLTTCSVTNTSTKRTQYHFIHS